MVLASYKDTCHTSENTALYMGYTFLHLTLLVMNSKILSITISYICTFFSSKRRMIKIKTNIASVVTANRILHFVLTMWVPHTTNTTGYFEAICMWPSLHHKCAFHVKFSWQDQTYCRIIFLGIRTPELSVTQLQLVELTQDCSE